MRRHIEATISEEQDWSGARHQQSVRARLQYDYLIRRPSHVRCLRGQRIRLSYYSPDSSGWRPDRPSPREWKTDEARFSRKERRAYKRTLGLHMRKTWLAQNYWSLAWTTCGHWVLGPPLGTWDQYPRSKGMRQREARAAKRKKAASLREGTGEGEDWVMHGLRQMTKAEQDAYFRCGNCDECGKLYRECVMTITCERVRASFGSRACAEAYVKRLPAEHRKFFDNMFT